MRPVSFREATARQRVRGLLDPGSFTEWLGPEQNQTSPHLRALGAPVSFDDGIVVGEGSLAGRNLVLVAQEGQFNGGSVGEVHGAKFRGALQRALATRPRGVVCCIDSGGVRLHEANAGLIAISEIMRALFAVQSAGIPVWALVGGSCGAFGGMGIVARLCDALIMSEEGRLGLSGPEVIETVKGVEEFDARDRALVWRITGGKIRRTLGEATQLVEDDIAAFREALQGLLEGPAAPRGFALETLRADQLKLAERAGWESTIRDGQDVWARMGWTDSPALMTVAAFNRRLAGEAS